MPGKDYGWPVVLSGYSDWNSTFDYPEGVGHTWDYDRTSATTFYFCDGTTQENETSLQLHMNWGEQEAGQSGNYNGWFAFNDWNIPQTSTNYQYFNELAYNIHP